MLMWMGSRSRLWWEGSRSSPCCSCCGSCLQSAHEGSDDDASSSWSSLRYAERTISISPSSALDVSLYPYLGKNPPGPIQWVLLPQTFRLLPSPLPGFPTSIIPIAHQHDIAPSLRHNRIIETRPQSNVVGESSSIYTSHHLTFSQLCLTTTASDTHPNQHTLVLRCIQPIFIDYPAWFCGSSCRLSTCHRVEKRTEDGST